MRGNMQELEAMQASHASLDRTMANAHSGVPVWYVA